jgi:hypothetical protein
VHRESGQATVEWVALALAAALILGAAATHSSTDDDRGLGQLVAKRIASAPSALEVGRDTATGAPASISAPAAGAPAPAARSPAHRPARFPAHVPAIPPEPRPPAPAPTAPASRARAVDAFRRLRGVGKLASRAWIVCLGYRRWRYEMEHPLAPTEPVPLGEALEIANTCLNPYAFLFEG